jgi:hypothetical protein
LSSTLVAGVVVGCAPDAAEVAVDETAALFPRDRVLDVALSVAPSDWDALRVQGHDLARVTTRMCNGELPQSPYDTFRAHVRVDDVVVQDVGLRKKGLFGSDDAQRPSLKIAVDEFDEEARLRGSRNLTLNNARTDPSFLDQCLGYFIFARAGLPAPRCAFATVAVNDAPLGLYVHVESIKKPFLARAFNDDDGNLYEGAKSDFRPDMQVLFEKKTNEDDPGMPEIAALTAALQRPDDELLPALDEVIDVDAFLRFWAVEVLLNHLDGYANNQNNFFVYAPTTDRRLRFVPWGLDRILQNDGFAQHRLSPLHSTMARARLSRRLYEHPEGRARYHATLDDVLATAWNEDVLEQEALRLQDLVLPALDADARGSVLRAVEKTIRFLRDRRDVIESERAAGLPAWTEPERALCLSFGGIDAAVSTTFGATNPDGGTVALADTGTTVAVATRADHGAAGAIDVDVRVPLPTGGFSFVRLGVPVRTPVGVPVPVDGVAAWSLVHHQSAGASSPSLFGVLSGGTLTLDELGERVPGAPVRARFSGTLRCVPHHGHPCAADADE